MELLDVQQEIMNKIRAIDKGMDLLVPYAEKKCKKIAEYDKVLAERILSIKKDNPVTVCKELAKGECSDEREVMEVSVDAYKILNKKLDLITEQLGALRTVNKYLSEV